MASQLHIKTKDLLFVARWEDEMAPKTCAAIRRFLPIVGKIAQAKWSGEAGWTEIDHLDLGIDFENHTLYPSKGELLVYPGFISFKEILIPYGSTSFASKMGPLPGNHFATIVDGLEQLKELGRRIVWEGAQDIEFAEVDG